MANGVGFRRRGLLVAAAGAGGVLAVLLAQDIVTGIVSIIGSAVTGGYLGYAVAGAWSDALGTSLPFAAGVFLSFWQLAPVGGPLRLAHVVTRSLLAAGVGSVTVLLVNIVINLVNGVRGFVQGDTAYVASAGADVVASLGYALQTAVITFVTVLPLVVLAAVLVWVFLRGRDSASQPSGILDL